MLNFHQRLGAVPPDICCWDHVAPQKRIPFQNPAVIHLILFIISVTSFCCMLSCVTGYSLIIVPAIKPLLNSLACASDFLF